MSTPAAIQSMNPPPVMPAARTAHFPNPPRVRYSLRDNEPGCVDRNVEKTYSRSMTAAGVLLFMAANAAFFGMVTSGPGDALSAKEQSYAVMPLVGAMLVSAAICLIHNVQEGKRIIAGRVIFALIGGFCGPWLIEFMYPPVVDKISDFRPQFLMGACFGWMGYIFSRAFVEKFFLRAKPIADSTVGRLERKYVPRRTSTEKLEP